MHDDDRAERLAGRWAAVSAERERLLALASRRTLNRQDAEDCVQEALLRSVEFEGLDEERVAPFLTTVAMRLCADQHRVRQRQERLDKRLAAWRAEEPGPEEAVCDRAEAAWIRRSLRGAPARQQQVLEAKAQGLSDAEIAQRLGVSYSSVASALARARSAVRAALAAGAMSLAGLLRRPRAVAVTAATAAAVTVAITTTTPVVKAPAPRAGNDVAVVVAPAGRPAAQPPVARQPRRRAAAPRPRAHRAPDVVARPRPAYRPVASAGPARVERKETGRTFAEEIDNCLRNGISIDLWGETACREPSDPRPS